jgi:hypothetical protein
MQYTTENTEGYSAEDLATLNRIYDHRVSLLDEDERENADLLQQISERILFDYDLAREEIPGQIQGGDLVPARVVIQDLEIRGEGDERAAVALVDLEYPQSGEAMTGILLVCYPEGEDAPAPAEITQADWQTPSHEIPADLSGIRWQVAPLRAECVVGPDGLPRYAALW